MRSIVGEKSLEFAIRIVKLSKYLREEKKEYELSKQLLRSGTSIGANLFESKEAQSNADFINKMSIALKEASETQYWLTLLFKTDYLTKNEFDSIYNDCGEITKMLTSAIKTCKTKTS